MYAPQLFLSILDYKLVEMLVFAVHNGKCHSNLRTLNSEVLRIIVEYAFPGLGALVPAFVDRRNIKKQIEEDISKRDPTSTSNANYFRIFLRKRPILAFEQNVG